MRDSQLFSTIVHSSIICI